MLNLIPVSQSIPDIHIEDVSGAVREEIRRVGLELKPGARIAIGVGSRGISGLQTVVASVVREIRNRGGEPFIVPAMGSHGGATDQGQADVLEGYGITESAVGAPVRSSMEAVELPRGDAPCRVFMDRTAHQADGVIVINRVKSHTDFRGPHESGLVKMLVIGLGKQRQALEVHRSGVRGLRDYVPQVAREILGSGKVLLGIGLVENGHHKLSEIRAVLPHEFHAMDHELLEHARKLAPCLPVKDLDVLIVDRLGKDISGTGLDTNVIGRIGINGEAEPVSPRVKAIVVCGLTPDSHGNAIGVGLADVITRDLYDQIDIAATGENVMTSTFLGRGKIPIVAPTCRHAYDWAFRTCGPVAAQDLKVVRIRDTLALGHLLVSEPVWSEIQNHAGITKNGPPAPAFLDDETLPDCW